MQDASARVKTQGKVVLDWSRLLGFDQAGASERSGDAAARRLQLTKVGTKIGGKPKQRS